MSTRYRSPLRFVLPSGLNGTVTFGEGGIEGSVSFGGGGGGGGNNTNTNNNTNSNNVDTSPNEGSGSAQETKNWLDSLKGNEGWIVGGLVLVLFLFGTKLGR